jgi:shikimate kinase
MNNIILIGMMGSGKSTLSHLICKKTGYDFIDTDSIIESNEGMSITDIFSSKGEAYFRNLELNYFSH